MSQSDGYGVVLIGRNEGERLRRSIESVMKLTDRIVYADSASTDSSVAMAESMGAIVVQLDDSQPLNAARGRNAGFTALLEHYPECKFVQFLDGDCRLVESWPGVAIAFLDAHANVAIACGRRFESSPDASFYNRIADEEWNTPVGKTEACGGDAMVRVDAFEQIGGFNANLMASEEPEMTARLRERGWQIWRIDAEMSEHDAAIFSFSQWWRRTVRSGYGYAQAWASDAPHAEPGERCEIEERLCVGGCPPASDPSREHRPRKLGAIAADPVGIRPSDRQNCSASSAAESSRDSRERSDHDRESG